MDTGFWILPLLSCNLTLMRNIDQKLKILFAIVATGLLLIVGVLIYQSSSSSVRMQYGDVDSWTRHTSSVNNLAFRVPEEFEVIVPADFENVPFSIVKAGERGESVLMQVGTFRLETPAPLTSTEAAIADYERRFPGTRETLDRIERDINGRRVITLVQEEANGRIVVDTFAYDPAVMVAPSNLQIANAEVREISLQLPATTSAKDRRLYTNVYLDMIESLEFLHEPSPDAPQGVPSGWSYVEDAEAGISFWLPPDWELTGSVPASFPGTDPATQVLTFATKDVETNNNAAQQIIRALPAGQSILLAGFMTEAFVQPFRDAAIAGTLADETLTMPGIGGAVSLEARHLRENTAENIPDATEPKTLLVFVGGADTPQPGRGYVFETTLPDGKANELRLTQLRSMTQSLRLIESAQ